MRRTGLIVPVLLVVATGAGAQSQKGGTTFDPAETPATPQAAAPVPADAAVGSAFGVPADVTALRVAGSWEADGKKGFSRVVGVTTADRQRFYVQWLSMPDGIVLQTTELKDDDADKLTFGDIRAEQENDGVSVFMDTIPDKDGMRDTWVLVIGAPGEIRFGPATN